MGHETWKASHGWLDRFKQRNNICFKTVCGESASVSDVAVKEWHKEVLSKILDKFKPCDIYNADETGLFWQCLPNKTMDFKGNKCHGGKKSKERVTLLLAGNMDGSDKIKPLIIGKSENPRCFKNLNRSSLPVDYKSQSNSWMTGDIFTSWLRKLDRHLQFEKRKIALIIDNCRAHPRVEGLQAITVYFLPPNATSKLQPLDQGIIQAFKIHYRKALVCNYLLAVEEKRSYKPTLLDAIMYARAAWNSVSPKTIQNCWFHCIFPEISDEEFHQQCLIAQEIKEPQSEIGLEAMADEIADSIGIARDEFSNYVHVDDDANAYGELTDEEIIQSVTTKQIQSCKQDDDDDDDDQPITIPSYSEMAECIKKMKLFVASVDGAEHMYENVSAFESFVTNQHRSKQKQTDITSYFLQK